MAAQSLNFLIYKEQIITSVSWGFVIRKNKNVKCLVIYLVYTLYNN